MKDRKIREIYQAKIFNRDFLVCLLYFKAGLLDILHNILGDNGPVRGP